MPLAANVNEIYSSIARGKEKSMRRKDRQVTDIKEIQNILDECKTCHLAMVDHGRPYVIPLSYAYEMEGDTLILYFHSAKQGRKLDLLRENNAVCFEMCFEGEPIFAEKTPCNSGYYFSSVHGFGTVQFIDNEDEKCTALTLLMQHQAELMVQFTPAQADTVCVYKVISTDFTGKKKLHPPT